jgi:hypothetical protein
MGESSLDGALVFDPIDFPVLVPCPACGRKTCHKMSALRTNPTYRCRQCDQIIDIEVNAEAEIVRTASTIRCQTREPRESN